MLRYDYTELKTRQAFEWAVPNIPGRHSRDLENLLDEHSAGLFLSKRTDLLNLIIWIKALYLADPTKFAGALSLPRNNKHLNNLLKDITHADTYMESPK